MSALQGKKTFPAPILENIPDELKAPEVRRWVVWKLTEVKNKKGETEWKKLLYQAHNGYLAKPNGPETWCSYDVAVKAYTEKRELTYTEKGAKPRKLQGGPDGLGFVLGPEESTGKTYFGVDLDGLTTPERWEWANKIIKALDSYGEISPSGKGVHVLGIGTKGPDQTGTNCRKLGVEVYDKTHYFTVTGNHIQGTPKTINERQEQLRAFHATIWRPKDNHKEKRRVNDEARAERLGSPKGEPPVPLSLVALTDQEIVEKLLNEKGSAGDKARDLFIYGFYQKHFPDSSEDGGNWSGADQSLMNKIEFYCINSSDEENAQQLNRVFSDPANKLAQREKWTQGDLKSNPYRQATIAKAIAFGKEKDDHWSPNYGKSRKGKRGKKKGENRTIAAVITEEILRRYEMVTVEKAKIILMKMENGGWKQVSKLKIGALTQEIGGRDKVTPSVREDVYGKILHENLIPDEAFEKRPDLFMDAEGKIFSSITLAIIKPEELEEGVFVIHQLGAVYDPSAPVPDEFLQGMELFLPGEDDRLALQEHMGSCLYRRMEYDKALTVLGDTRNGKSTMFEIFSLVIGDENISAITLQEMANPYKPYDMWGKLLNIQDDLPADPIRNTSFFKTHMGGMPVTLMKKYGDPFKAKVYCKNLFGCNLLPPAANKSDKGYYSKFLCVSAPNTFTLDNEWSDEEREAGKLEPGHVKADPKLVDKLTSDPRKMSGILNWMLKGLARLEKQQGYSIKLSPEENRLRYDAMASPLGEIGTFLDMVCEFARDYSKETRKADLFLLYNTYLQAKKVPGISKTTFNEALVSAGHEPLKFRNPNAEPPGIALEDANIKRPYVIKGLVLKKNWKVIYEDWLELISISQNTAKIGA